MIEFTLDKRKGILLVRPIGPLSEEDFTNLAKEVDPFIEEAGNPVSYTHLTLPTTPYV